MKKRIVYFEFNGDFNIICKVNISLSLTLESSFDCFNSSHTHTHVVDDTFITM